MTECPDYCTSPDEGRQFCQLRNGCKSGERMPCPIDHHNQDKKWWMVIFDVEMGMLVKRNGAVDYKVRCIHCGRESLCLSWTERQELRDQGCGAASAAAQGSQLNTENNNQLKEVNR